MNFGGRKKREAFWEQKRDCKLDQIDVFLRSNSVNALKCNESQNVLTEVMILYSFTFSQKDQMAYLVFSVS